MAKLSYPHSCFCNLFVTMQKKLNKLATIDKIIILKINLISNVYF